MQITLLGYADLGRSFGVDDEALRAEHVSAAFGGLPVAPPPAFPNLELPLGEGLRVDLLETPVAAAWAAGIAGELGLGAPRMTRCEVVVHAIGVVLVRADVEASGPDPLETYRVVEAAAYGPFSDALAPSLRALVAQHPCEGALARLSRRHDLAGVAPADLIPGFQAVLVADAEEAEAALAAIRGYESDPPVIVETDEAKVHVGWASAVVVRVEPDVERTLRVLGLATLHFALCRALERAFAARMGEAMRAQLRHGRASFSVGELNQLRVLALAALEGSAPTRLNDNVSDVGLLAAAHRVFGLPDRQERLRASSAAFGEIQAQEAEVRALRRDRNLNLFVLAITGLTLVSVVADALGTVDYDQNLVPRLMRAVLLVVAPVTAVGVTFYAVRRSGD